MQRHKLYENFQNGGGHPDDWEADKKGAAPKNDRTSVLWQARADMAEPRKHCRMRCVTSQKASVRSAEAATAKEHKAREKAEAEAAKLREQLNKAKEHANDECADLFSSLLPQDTVDKLSADQIGERMQTLFAERERREYNLTAQVDLVIGQLTEALYQRLGQLADRQINLCCQIVLVALAFTRVCILWPNSVVG